MRESRLNVTTVAGFYFGLFAVAMWINFSQELFRFSPTGPDRTFLFLVHAAIGVTAGGVIIIVNAVALRFFPALRSLAKTMDEMIGPISWPEAFLLAAFSAMAEEFFFRGVLQPYLGVVATSVAFGLLHTGPGKQFMAWTVFAMLAGLLFGALYELTGNLLCPVTAHFIVNFLNLKALRRFSESPEHTT